MTSAERRQTAPPIRVRAGELSSTPRTSRTAPGSVAHPEAQVHVSSKSDADTLPRLREDKSTSLPVFIAQWPAPGSTRLRMVDCTPRGNSSGQPPLAAQGVDHPADLRNLTWSTPPPAMARLLSHLDEACRDRGLVPCGGASSQRDAVGERADRRGEAGAGESGRSRPGTGPRPRHRVRPSSSLRSPAGSRSCGARRHRRSCRTSIEVREHCPAPRPARVEAALDVGG